MERPKEIAIAMLVAALVAGGAMGYSAGHLVAARENAPGEHGAMRHYVAAQLDLTPAQEAGMDTILDARHREMTRLIAPVQPQLDSLRGAARKQIMTLLTPAQQKKFQDLIQQRDKAAAAEANRK
jgi:Spy/CpxP family protein refolding chaperone